jgi:hypothetical protein
VIEVSALIKVIYVQKSRQFDRTLEAVIHSQIVGVAYPLYRHLPSTMRVSKGILADFECLWLTHQLEYRGEHRDVQNLQVSVWAARNALVGHNFNRVCAAWSRWATNAGRFEEFG